MVKIAQIYSVYAAQQRHPMMCSTHYLTDESSTWQAEDIIMAVGQDSTVHHILTGTCTYQSENLQNV